MCDDMEATKADLEAKGVEFRGEPEDMGFGIGVTMVLPGGRSCSSTNHATNPRSTSDLAHSCNGGRRILVRYA